MRCEHWDKLNICFWCGKDITRKEGELPPECTYSSKIKQIKTLPHTTKQESKS